MKDKEKQIKSDCEKCIHDKVCYDCLMTDKCWGKDNNCEHYQPKLPEDSIVISREEKQEYENLVKLLIYDKPIKSRVYEFIKDTKEQSRKETAEKIFQRLFEEHSAFSNTDIVVIWQVKEVLSDIAKEFGVEIKE